MIKQGSNVLIRIQPKQLIFLIWAILTLINLNKAYHIDDTFHLEAAEQIQENPFHPMSGSIDWDNEPRPIYQYNQPPLLFYLILLTKMLFGNGEVPMHLMLSVFTFLSLYFFYKISVVLKAKSSHTLLVLFAFCPAFMVNQNLMTDIPIMALTLGSIFFLLNGMKNGTIRDYLISALLISAGLMIKYSLLPLMVVILATLLMTKRFKEILIYLIPVLVLILWSIWNIWEFGSIHLLDRPRSDIRMIKIWGFISALGSVLFIFPILIHSTMPKRIMMVVCVALLLAFAGGSILVYLDLIQEEGFNKGLSYFFLLNGVALLLWFIYAVLKELQGKGLSFFDSPLFPIVLCVIGFASFNAMFAPFMATRHVLPIIPFFLLFAHRYFEGSGLIKQAVLVISIAIGSWLGISDWVYADFYRRNASEFTNRDKTIWSVGHWGWQWYSKQAGMKIYGRNSVKEIRKGDLLIYPKDIHKQKIDPGIKLQLIEKRYEVPDLRTFFSGKKFASLYASSPSKPAWIISNEPIDTILVFRIEEILAGNQWR